ncbi:MAG: hypothetical protein LBJ89_04490, partial [Holosporales bacterium]|nr:hypothetical protein [Holosporales bacterium]
GRSFFFSLLGGACSGALAYFLAQVDVTSFCAFICLMFFLLMFTVPIWCRKSEEFPSFCFSMQKGMFGAMMIAAAMLFVFLLIDIFGCIYATTLAHASIHIIGNHRLFYWQIIFPLVTTLFCPLFTLYSVRKDNCKNSLITEGNGLQNVSEPFERFVESGFVYVMEFVALCILIFYGKAFLDVLMAIASPKFLDWGSEIIVLFLFFSSTIMYFVANSPIVRNNYPRLKALRLFRKYFPIAWLAFAALAAFKMIGIETVSCITSREPAILLAWAIVMSFLIATKRWLSNRVTSVIFFSATICTGTLFYFEKQVNQFETRVFDFLEKKEFIKDGVIQNNKKASWADKVNVAHAFLWLLQKENEEILLSRLGTVVTSSDGKKYFELQTTKGTVRKEMDDLRSIYVLFGGDDMKGTYLAEKHSIQLPLRFPFKGVGECRGFLNLQTHP